MNRKALRHLHVKRYSKLHVGVDGDELDNNGNKLCDNAADLLPVNGVKKNAMKTKRKALVGCRAASKKRKTKTPARHTEPDIESLIGDSIVIRKALMMITKIAPLMMIATIIIGDI